MRKWSYMTEEEAREALSQTIAVWNVLAFISGWPTRHV